jgi:RNA polymerase II subunit A C-terminal domain phosphatase
MHIYTMGTRAYAEQVCAAIDPDGEVFGGRVLSRDESGSGYMLYLTTNVYSTFVRSHSEKPATCDTSMVVIIDDRADVWEWCPNLIKVIPCSLMQF